MSLSRRVLAWYRPAVYRRKDSFYMRAKAAGYRSRAAFKLLQLAQQARLFRRGDRVLDLGAWPGGWLQVAAELVGPSGRVVGVDLRRIEALPQPNVRTVVGDIVEEVTQRHMLEECGGPADVILSDLAPKLSGVRARDQAQADALVQSVLAVAERVLRPGGKLVVKLFTGEAATRFVGQLRSHFGNVRTTRPEATRKGSSEMYAIAADFHGGGSCSAP